MVGCNYQSIDPPAKRAKIKWGAQKKGAPFLSLENRTREGFRERKRCAYYSPRGAHSIMSRRSLGKSVTCGKWWETRKNEEDKSTSCKIEVR